MLPSPADGTHIERRRNPAVPTGFQPGAPIFPHDSEETVTNWHKLAIGFGLLIVGLIVINNISFLKGLTQVRIFPSAAPGKAA
jgi:hypothetical protein